MSQRIESIRFDREQFIEKLQAAGITQEELQAARSEGPEAFRTLLESHGIEAPPPPPRHQNGANNEMIEKLKELGIPEDVIKQGPQAVFEYAKQHNITLPEPPDRRQGANQGINNDSLQSVIQELKARQNTL